MAGVYVMARVYKTRSTKQASTKQLKDYCPKTNAWVWC